MMCWNRLRWVFMAKVMVVLMGFVWDMVIIMLLGCAAYSLVSVFIICCCILVKLLLLGKWNFDG